MNYPWLEAYCLSKTGAVKEYKAEWDVDRYLVGGKCFAFTGGNNKGQSIITLKLEPSKGDFFRQMYEDVEPGYYSNKLHYNSINLAGSVPDDVLRDMIDESYELIFGSLTKKLQKDILG